VWLIPPGSLHHLSETTAKDILRWTHRPTDAEWWGIMWVKAHAYKEMRKAVAAAKRRAESELDVLSDEEIDEARLVRTATPPAVVLSAAAAAPPLPTLSATSSQTSKEALSIIKNPALAASTASYLDSLILRLGGASQLPPLPPTTTTTPVYASPPAVPPYEHSQPMVPLPPVPPYQPLQPTLGVLPPQPPVVPLQAPVGSTWTTTQPVRPPSGWVSSMPQR
jgi:hypothetical protein